ncbi:MAG TPA: glycogen debranching N-terminal domain-containing protein [bacterium]|nr:glycogen debranching N-terminal domain-containing protein [bacterium]
MLSDIKVGPDFITVHWGYGFIASAPDGTIRGHSEQGFFLRDTRFLSHYRHQINGRKWTLLNSAPISHTAARFEFTNPALQSAAGPIPKHVVGLTVDRRLSTVMQEEFTVINYHRAPVRLTLAIELGTDFADVFEVRRNHPRVRRAIDVTWDAGRQRVTAEYARDGYRARTVYWIRESTTPAQRKGPSLLFDMTLTPAARWTARVQLTPERDDIVHPAAVLGTDTLPAARQSVHDEWREAFARIRTSDDTLTYTLRRSAEEVIALLLDPAQGPDAPSVLAAGAPWFVALFGRDSAIAGLQTLPLHRAFALGALKSLGEYQATVSDDFRDADPGKILHELRVGELARLGLIPHTPYYGTADATLLYPILLREAYRWTGDRELLAACMPPAARCLEWMDRYGDRDGDGFQEYLSRSSRGITHQGWKDSGDGTVYADGRPVEPPVALCELQGYAYDAKRCMAELYEVTGDAARAGSLREEARRLAERFEAAFWLEEEGTYAFGLDPRKTPIRSVVSNAGHCLWSGIASVERARRVISRLLRDDMWNGWGIRTLSAAHPAFNPYAYQRGAVWPHDNSLIAAGCRRYGDAAAAARITRGVLDAALVFRQYRLPEVFSGLPRDEHGFPVQYLGANIPQAWAAGAPFAFVQVLLGLRADAPRGRLELAPALPPWLDWIEVENLEIGESRVAFRCTRDGARSRIDVLDVTGPCAIEQVEDVPAGAARES